MLVVTPDVGWKRTYMCECESRYCAACTNGRSRKLVTVDDLYQLLKNPPVSTMRFDNGKFEINFTQQYYYQR